jgi:pimeloyl-ACP methyl ester carboxylesterase
MEIRTDLLAQQAASLLVLLPGAHMSLADFWQQGLVAAVRERRLATDILAADINYTHVMEKTVVERLHEKVILPARAKGYRQIWLAGISLGALNALMYAAQHAQLLTGLHLIAPYPGTGDICAEIREAGGPVVWARTPAAEQGDEREAWRWLAHQHAGAIAAPWVSFSCGSEDRFVRNQRMLSELISPERVHWQVGRHDWSAWLALWQRWLEQCPLERLPGEVCA